MKLAVNAMATWRRTGVRISAAASHTLDERNVRNIQQNDLVRIDVGLLKCLCLLACAGEAIQQPAAIDALGSRELLLDEVDNKGIGNKLACIHVSLRFLAEGRAGLHCSAQHVAGAEMGNLEFFDDLLALGALARGRCARDDQAVNLGGECAGKCANGVDLVEHW